MFKRILVPVDGSSPSSAGLRAAIALARRQNARIRLVHIAQVVIAPAVADGFAVSELYDLIGQVGERLLQRTLRRCQRHRIKCDTKLYVEIAGRAADLILEERRSGAPTSSSSAPTASAASGASRSAATPSRWRAAPACR